MTTNDIAIHDEMRPIIYNGHEIKYLPSFNGDGMKYQWILRDTARSFIVMQHETIDEAFAMIDKFENGELI